LKTAEGRARVIAAGLAETLGRALPSCFPLDVRAVPWGRWWVVRAEMCARDGFSLAELLSGLPGCVNIDGWPWREAMEFEGAWGFDDPDPVLWAPGWYVVRPGIDYRPGYASAVEAAAALRRILPPVLLAGPMDFDADTWEDGMGVVRVTLNPDDASKLDARVGDAADCRYDGGLAA
jgi:hypothetical protein